MGSNYSTNMANLFLFYYEAKHMNETSFPDEYRFTFRYIDDLVAINNTRVQEEIGNIYPDCMELEETVMSPFKIAHYLDLNIIVNDLEKCFITSIYDKRRDFEFEFLSLPNAESNIPSHIIKNVITGQLKRFATICSEGDGFLFNSWLLHQRLLANGYQEDFLIKLFKLFSQQFKYDLIKFAPDKNSFASFRRRFIPVIRHEYSSDVRPLQHIDDCNTDPVQ
jgi:hypothetical protein